MRNRRWLLTLGVLAAPLLGASNPTTVTLADDAYHYAEWNDGRHDGNFTEWWYFNYYDTRRDVEAIVVYLVTDPQNLTGHGMAQVTSVAYTPDGIVSANDTYPPASFWASPVRADVQIDSNRIRAVSPNVYRISGASLDGRLSWDLQHVRQSKPWMAADRIPVGTLPWELMSWLIYMPRASVTGHMTVDGRLIPVNATGYHDHNWGEWIFPNALWNWAQYSEPGFAFELGDFIGKPAGVASIDYRGSRVVFTKDQYKLVHTRWAFDRSNRIWYPTQSLLIAANESLYLVQWVTASETVPIRGDVPWPLPDAIIYEQTARFSGELWVKKSNGRWMKAHSWDGSGFKEYTAKHY